MSAIPQDTERPTLLLLQKARTLLEEGKYAFSLESVQEAKRAEPHNIYVLAFEKQIEQLIELAAAKLLTEDQRADILESIPGIIERAAQGTHLLPAASSHQQLRTAPAEQSPDRSAAMEWLKNQYFQHAHEYVRKGEYQHALAEIRRIFIIDPKNELAQNFERQIQELSELKSAQIPKLAERAKSDEVSHRAAGRPSAPPSHRESHPAHHPSVHRGSDHDDRETKGAEEKPHRRRLSNSLVAIIMIGLLFIGYGIFRIFTKPQAVKSAGTEQPGLITPRHEIYFQDPNAPQEQPFVITVTDSARQADSAAAARQRPPAESRRRPGQSQRNSP